MKYAKHIDLIRCYIKNNVLNVSNTFLGHESERKVIHDLLQKTVELGESNSALLIGPRGAGKTTLISSVLNQLLESKTFQGNCILVKLHGLIHTDDKLALKSITAQLNMENVVDGLVFGSFAENLAFLLTSLRSGHKETCRSVIFILEEFDLFCSHHNQTLLYNLFDVSQCAQAPICVLGITCRLDVMELLEKRVKSRFSHRQIFLFSEANNQDEKLDLYISKVKYLLSIQHLADKSLKSDAKREWNAAIEKLVANKKFILLMERLWNTDVNQCILNNILFSVASKLNKTAPSLTLETFQEEVKKIEQDEMVQVLQDLNTLELCLIIAMKHHCDIYDNNPMNFEMIYTRYLKFANTNSSVQLAQRPVVMKAFEHIQYLEIISLIDKAARNQQREYQMFKLLASKSQITEAISTLHGLPTEVVQWANSSLI